MRLGLGLALMVAGAPAAAAVGDRAPDFTARAFDGTKLSLADFRGKVLVINHWATWCGPCKAELPAMDAYYRQHRANGLAILAVTTEDSLPKASLKRLSEVMAIPMANRLKAKGAGYPLVRHAVPTSYVIDRAGVIRYAQAGAFSAESFAATVAPLLAESAP